MDKFSLKRIFGLGTQQRGDRRSKPRALPPGGTTLLVVDDSKTVVFSLKKMLEQNGYHILVAENGENAVELAKSAIPDLIFMDVIMPGMNGFRATRILNREPETSHIPIVIMSGDEQSMQSFWLKQIGAVDYLAKPFKRSAIFQTLEQHLKVSRVA